MELITSFTVFPLHFALVSFIKLFPSVFYLFMSHTHPRNTCMHTLCWKLLTDGHPMYPSTRTSICFTHCRCLIDVSFTTQLKVLLITVYSLIAQKIISLAWTSPLPLLYSCLPLSTCLQLAF